MTLYTLRIWDRGEKVINGTLPELSSEYVTFCQSRTDCRHGPATLRDRDNKEVGYINAKGEVWLKQPSHVLAFIGAERIDGGLLGI